MFKPQPGVWLPVSLFAALLGLTFYQILVFNDGHFTYALDDPYIGLAMAEELLHGNYGINPGEPASAASTILRPLLALQGLDPDRATGDHSRKGPLGRPRRHVLRDTPRGRDRDPGAPGGLRAHAPRGRPLRDVPGAGSGDWLLGGAFAATAPALR
ncbi:MAG TPA: hypothetical protein EYQ27_04970 [Gemmatimonadetes bacterium]|nr:hypothetical protein [Gemmatimonadota bacterium]